MKLTEQEQRQLEEINRRMKPLKKRPLSQELVRLGMLRSRLLNKLYGSGEYQS